MDGHRGPRSEQNPAYRPTRCTLNDRNGSGGMGQPLVEAGSSARGYVRSSWIVPSLPWIRSVTRGISVRFSLRSRPPSPSSIPSRRHGHRLCVLRPNGRRLTMSMRFNFFATMLPLWVSSTCRVGAQGAVARSPRTSPLARRCASHNCSATQDRLAASGCPRRRSLRQSRPRTTASVPQQRFSLPA